MATSFRDPTEEGDRRGAKPGEFGQRPHERDENLAIQIRNMGGFGLPMSSIADALGISTDTIRKHYGADWAQGKAQATANVAQRLYNLAMAGSVDACKFYLSNAPGFERSRGGANDTGAPTPNEAASLHPVNVNFVFVDTPEPGPASLLPENPRFLTGQTIDNATGEPIDPAQDGSR